MQELQRHEHCHHQPTANLGVYSFGAVVQCVHSGSSNSARANADTVTAKPIIISSAWGTKSCNAAKSPFQFLVPA